MSASMSREQQGDERSQGAPPRVRGSLGMMIEDAVQAEFSVEATTLPQSTQCHPLDPSSRSGSKT